MGMTGGGGGGGGGGGETRDETLPTIGEVPMGGGTDGVPGTASSSVTEAVAAPSDKEPESLPSAESAVVAPYEDATEPLPQAEPTAAAAAPSEEEVVAYSTLYDLDVDDFAMDDNYHMTFTVSPRLLGSYENELADLLNSPTDEGVLTNATVNQELEADCNVHDIPDEITIETQNLNGHESNGGSAARGNQDNNEDNCNESPIPDEITIETQNLNGHESNGGSAARGHQDDREENGNKSPIPDEMTINSPSPNLVNYLENELPSFIKTPENVMINASTNDELEADPSLQDVYQTESTANDELEADPALHGVYQTETTANDEQEVDPALHDVYQTENVNHISNGIQSGAAENPHEPSIGDQTRQPAIMENGIGSDQIINQTNETQAERDGEHSSGQGGANTGGHIPVILSVPRTYQGSLTLQDSGDHRFLTAEDLRVSVSSNVSWMRRNQILALLKNAEIFQLTFSELPDFKLLRRRHVITIATEALGRVAITDEYSSTRKILIERGPRKLKIAGVTIDCYEVKGDQWGRRRYTIDGTVHVLEWTAKRIPQEGQQAQVQRTVRTRSTPYARLVESNESVIESNARLMASSASVVASSASLVASNERLETAMTLLLECGRDLIDRLGRSQQK